MFELTHTDGKHHLYVYCNLKIEVIHGKIRN